MMTQKARPDDGKRTICCWARQILYCRLVRLSLSRNSSGKTLSGDRSELTEGRSYSICPWSAILFSQLFGHLQALFLYPS
jgi:hypothetical protein